MNDLQIVEGLAGGWGSSGSEFLMCQYENPWYVHSSPGVRIIILVLSKKVVHKGHYIENTSINSSLSSVDSQYLKEVLQQLREKMLWGLFRNRCYISGHPFKRWLF